jgi:hypothetical protein
MMAKHHRRFAMFRLKISGVLLIALLVPTAAMAAVRVQTMQPHLAGPILGGPGFGFSTLVPTNGSPSPSSGSGNFTPTGQIYGPNSGGSNSMNNNFGTSGLLGNSNGSPLTIP